MRLLAPKLMPFNSLGLIQMSLSISLLKPVYTLYFFSFKGHKNEKYKVDSCLSHSDSEVVSGSEDGRICFWDLIEGKLMHTIEKAHKTTVYSLSYHPEKAAMLSASSDGTVKLWQEKAEGE